ncbi:Stage III sporulation protein AF [compost metagenome]
MSILSEWLKEIIFVVLIAVFIDLLLPNRSMERYVKFVVSLIILLTLLSPVMKLLSMPSAEKLEMAISDNISDMDNPEMNQSTQQILQQGNELRRQRESEALQWTGEEAARQMKVQIQDETGQSVVRVVVKLSTGSDARSNKRNSKSNASELSSEQQLEPRITAVEVVMGDPSNIESDGKTISDAPKKVDNVEPVENVQVTVAIPPDATNNSSITANSSIKDSLQEAKDQTIRQIENLLREEWGVPREAVTVVLKQT